MKLKDIYDKIKYAEIELHSGYDGKLVATSHKTIQSFGDAEVLSIMPQMKITNDGKYTKAYLYIMIDYNDIKRIKQEKEK